MLKSILKYKKTSLFGISSLAGVSYYSLFKQTTPEKHVDAEK
jgi:hypothetical protein